jgi:hypothetical protein
MRFPVLSFVLTKRFNVFVFFVYATNEDIVTSSICQEDRLRSIASIELLEDILHMLMYS